MCDLLERLLGLDGLGVKVGQVEEAGVLLEAVLLREGGVVLVVAGDGLPGPGVAGDRRPNPRLGDVLADPEGLPLVIPGRRPRAVRASCSSAETSLFVTRTERRVPPRSRLRRITAWAVVPEPEKKSTTRAFGLLPMKSRRQSSTA
jgi:hypothetical protein